MRMFQRIIVFASPSSQLILISQLQQAVSQQKNCKGFKLSASCLKEPLQAKHARVRRSRKPLLKLSHSNTRLSAEGLPALDAGEGDGGPARLGRGLLGLGRMES